MVVFDWVIDIILLKQAELLGVLKPLLISILFIYIKIIYMQVCVMINCIIDHYLVINIIVQINKKQNIDTNH